MRYYNEYEKKFYDNAEQCEAAEKAYLAEQEKKRNSEAAAKAELVELKTEMKKLEKAYQEALNEVSKVRQQYNSKCNNFVRNYGYLPKDHEEQQFLSWLLGNVMP